MSTSKTIISFLLLLMSIHQQNWKKWQNKFFLEARRVGERGRGWGAGWRNGPKNVCTYE
jgi:hypothetical protein